MQRGHRRTDAAPADAACRPFTRKTVDGDVFAQAFVSKTVDGVMVGRVFGTKTVNGDLRSAKRRCSGKSLVSDKTLEPVAFGGKLTRRIEPGTFSRKITIGEPPVFGRKAVTSI